MHYIQVMLNELVSEGWVSCYIDEDTGHTYYYASRQTGVVRMLMISEAVASCELDRDGTYSIEN